MPSTIISSAPGKVILFGEHAVVYGYPAVAVAINKRAKVIVKESNDKYTILKAPNLYPKDLFQFSESYSIPENLQAIAFLINKLANGINSEITILSDLPPSAGLGSSAAVSVALIGALNNFYNHQFSIEDINKLAFEAEKIQHGSPSGIDNTIATYGGGIYYSKGHKERIEVNIDAPLVVANSFVERKTRMLVEKVKKIYERTPKKVKEIFEAIKDIALTSIDALRHSKIDQIGELMTHNHEYLSLLGVSHPKLEKIIKIFRSHYSLGGKLTGAGGGGCAIGLFAEEEDAIRAVKAIKEAGMDAFITSFSRKGLSNRLAFCTLQGKGVDLDRFTGPCGETRS